MDSGRWERLRGLFDAALDLQACERPSFIARSSEGDPESQRALESLVKHSLETGSSFDQAVVEAIELEASLPTAPALQGRTLAHYRVIEKIGEGGMGVVYRAADTRLGRDVAIKILPEAFTRDPERLARFEREARVLASLNHPNIATIHGLEEAEDVRFLVLELIKGVTLRFRLAEGALPLEMLVRLGAQIAAGLAKAHEAGVVHRDLKRGRETGHLRRRT
jgi:serine/threonine protein kinase